MKVEIDDRSGFCFGVVRAIELAEENIADGKSVISLGDIVHNDAEVRHLAQKGLQAVTEHEPIERLAGRTVLIRAHGEPPATYELASRYGVSLIDATCPVVARLQKTVAQAYSQMKQKEGQVVIFGRRGHAEVRGLAAQAGNDVIIIEREADLENIDFTRPIYFLAQTTSSLSRFESLGAEIKKRASGHTLVTIRDTVCRQVSGREQHLADFARAHDVVIFVAGGKSSNGKVLFETVGNANPRSYKIEYPEEVRREWFGNCRSAGVCGATSTPRWLMEEVANEIQKVCGDE